MARWVGLAAVEAVPQADVPFAQSTSASAKSRCQPSGAVAWSYRRRTASAGVEPRVPRPVRACTRPADHGDGEPVVAPEPVHPRLSSSHSTRPRRLQHVLQADRVRRFRAQRVVVAVVRLVRLGRGCPPSRRGRVRRTCCAPTISGARQWRALWRPGTCRGGVWRFPGARRRNSGCPRLVGDELAGVGRRSTAQAGGRPRERSSTIPKANGSWRMRGRREDRQPADGP